MDNAQILAKLIDEDYGLITKDGSRWGKAETHSSLVLDKERGLFFWNSQEIVGGPLEYLTKVRCMNLADARKYLVRAKNDIVAYRGRDYSDPIVYYPLVDAFWKAGLNNRAYWYRRGLVDSTIDRFQLGWYNGWYTVPIFLDGQLKNFQMRRDEPVKVMNPWYKNVPPHLFNADIMKFTDRIVITEGLVDAILLSQFGIPAVSKNAGNMVWNDGWFKYFIKQKQIFYVADHDKAGYIGAKIVANKLGVYKVKICTFDGRPLKYDTVDFFRDGGELREYEDLLYNKSRYIFEIPPFE